MVLTDEQLTELKAAELKILRSFIQACEKMGLRYYILYGTLLGAVRHRGFIPWDDDIDVGMPRADYDRFVRDGQQYLPENLFVQTTASDLGGYLNGFMKIRDDNTAFIETAMRKLPIHQGIFIDVFPLDYYDGFLDKPMKRWQLRLYLERLRGELADASNTGKASVLRRILRFIYPSTQKVLDKREKMFCNTKQTDMYACPCGAWGMDEIKPTQVCWYADGCVLEFEGIQVIAPKEYHKYLVAEYGDYMQLPPENQRVAHHDAVVIDPRRSYRDYFAKEEVRHGRH